MKMGRRLRCSSVAYRFRYAPLLAPCRRPILIATKGMLFRRQDTRTERFEIAARSQRRWILSRPCLKLCGVFHGFKDPVVKSFDLFVGITDHKFLFEVFEEVLFGLITGKNQVGVIMRLFKEAFKGG